MQHLKQQTQNCIKQDDKKLLEQLKTGFKITINWNKYIAEMRDQSKANNLNYLIDPAFNKVNRSFVLSVKMKKMEYLFQSIMLQS